MSFAGSQGFFGAFPFLKLSHLGDRRSHQRFSSIDAPGKDGHVQVFQFSVAVEALGFVPGAASDWLAVFSNFEGDGIAGWAQARQFSTALLDIKRVRAFSGSGDIGIGQLFEQGRTYGFGDGRPVFGVDPTLLVHRTQRAFRFAP